MQKAGNNDVSGLFSSLTTIAVDNNGNIWTADGEKGYLSSRLHQQNTQRQFIKHYRNMKTVITQNALKDWNYVLRLNQMSVLGT